jgi:predicted transcriptional regulator
MTELLQFVMNAASRLPDERQDYLARALMSLLEADAPAPEEIHPADRADVMRGLAEAERGEMATDEEVEAAYRSFDE